MKVPQYQLAGKKYSSVEDMIRDSNLDEDFKKELTDHMASRHIVRFLITKRAVKGLTVSDLAAMLGWSEDKVYEFEESIDNNLKLGDLKRYSCAVDCSLGLDINEWTVNAADADPEGLLRNTSEQT